MYCFVFFVFFCLVVVVVVVVVVFYPKVKLYFSIFPTLFQVQFCNVTKMVIIRLFLKCK